jgi:hypothetical protein
MVSEVWMAEMVNRDSPDPWDRPDHRVQMVHKDQPDLQAGMRRELWEPRERRDQQDQLAMLVIRVTQARTPG